MTLSAHDREDMNTLHTVANGTGSAATRDSRKRSHDCLEQRTSPWNAKPTVIQTPGAQGKSRTAKEPPALNPYSQSSYDNLNSVAHTRAAKPNPFPRRNPNSLLVVAPGYFSRPGPSTAGQARPSKKLKLERSSDSRHGVGTQTVNATPKEPQDRNFSPTDSSSITPALQEMSITPARSSIPWVPNSGKHKGKSHVSIQDESPSKHVIDVDDQEDLGQSWLSSDDLRLGSGSGTVGEILGVSAPSEQHAFNKGPEESVINPSPPAAPHTRALKRQLVKINRVETDSDPIENSEDFDNLFNRPQSPESFPSRRKSAISGIVPDRVKQTIAFYESRERPPQIDLVSKMKRKKNDPRHPHNMSMRQKPPKRTPPPPLELTEYVYSRNSHRNDLALPLEAFAFGTHIYHSVNKEETQPKSWLRKRGNMISIVNAPPDSGTEFLRLELASDILTFDFPVDDNATRTFPLLAFELRKTNTVDNFVRVTSDFEGHQKFLITIKPLTSHPMGSVDNINKFTKELRQGADAASLAFLHANALRARWEDLLNASSEQSPTHHPSQSVKPRPNFVGATSLSLASKLPISSSVSEPHNVRRSARHSIASRPANHTSSPPAEEIILLYPPSGTGAVNVSYGDLKRLEPGEYLNDTLIELGLKLWLNDLRTERPEFAEQVHVFSSFFYTQLNQKNAEEGYQSVRKWTSKFDLFKKKYIIVPINEHLHWYLAIICYPERTLQKPVPPQIVTPNVTTRTKARESTSSQRCSPSHVQPSSDRLLDSNDGAASVLSLVEDEQEVEREMCTDHEPSHPSSPSRFASPARSSSLTADEMGVVPATESEGEDVAMEGKPKSPRLHPTNFQGVGAIQPRNFYSTASASGSKSHIGLISEDEEEIDFSDNLMDIDVISSNTEQTNLEQPFIFSFDSLGARHPHALRVLSRYLSMEAKDKKGWGETVPAIVRQASVPVQPNYCDCGVYLLHFVEQFMSGPDTFSQQIMQNKSRKASQTSKLDRERLWSHDKVAGRRQALKQKIVTLSNEWRQEKQADGKGKGKEKVDAGVNYVPVEVTESDSDIEVLEMNTESNKLAKTPAIRRQKALRLR